MKYLNHPEKKNSDYRNYCAFVPGVGAQLLMLKESVSWKTPNGFVGPIYYTM